MNLSLNSTDFAALSPLLILLAGALVLLLFESFFSLLAKKTSSSICLITIASACYAAMISPVSESPLLTPWLTFDLLGRFFTVFFLLIGAASAFLASSFFQRFEVNSIGEYYFFLLSCLFGLVLIGNSADFLILFLGIEILSISLYILCGYMKMWKLSHEASLKYFFMGSLATAFLIYGIALLYGATGSTQYGLLLSHYISLVSISDHALFFGGVALISLALAFKAAIFPFHLWAPDVYEGASTPVTAFMAVGTKIGAFAAFIRVFFDALPNFDLFWNESMALLAIFSLIYANIVALRQVQLRRFFAYSGISHAGFLLIPLAAGTQDALPALLFYLIVYALATFGAFAVIAFLDKNHQGVVLQDLYGLFKYSPVQASILTLCMLTLAGIPPTAGFFAKLFIFKIALQADYHVLVIIALLTAILSAFYYLRIVSVMFSEKIDEETPQLQTWSAILVGTVACGGVIALSIYPGPILSLLLTIGK